MIWQILRHGVYESQLQKLKPAVIMYSVTEEKYF